MKNKDIMIEELPESYKELVDNQQSLNFVKENAMKQALKYKVKSALNCFIWMNGHNISITLKDIFTLYDIGQGLLYKVKLFLFSNNLNFRLWMKE